MSIYAAYSGAMLILASAGFFLFWNTITTITIGFLFFVFSLLSIKAINKKLSYNKFLLIVILVFSLLVIQIPFRKHEPLGFGFVSSLFFLYFLLLDKRELIKISDALAILLAFVSFSAFIVFILSIFGVTIPSLQIGQSFRANPEDFYIVYPGSIVLSTQVWDLGLGKFVRTSGVLKEPGHFAILCALVLTCSGFSMKKRRYFYVTLGGLLTFSPAFYIYIFVVYFFSRFSFVKTVLFVFSLFILAIFYNYNLIPEQLANRVFFNYLEVYNNEGLMAIVESRSGSQFKWFYDNISMVDKVIGMGSKAVEHSGYGTNSSDYRAFIVNRGFIGVLSMLLFYFLLLRKVKNKSLLFSMCFFILLTFMHRSSFLIELWYIVLVLVFSVNTDVGTNKNQNKWYCL